MSHFFSTFGLPPGKAICYSGFREGQQPGGAYPSYSEILEDLKLLQPHWPYLRLYDTDLHAQTVLQVIEQEKLPFRVMLGAFIEAEMNNYGCPWGGADYSEETLESNARQNADKMRILTEWANRYSDIVFSLSVGNEACVDWTDHYVPVQKVVQYAQMIKDGCRQPVTYCDNYVPWMLKLEPLADVIDFISIHTYPVWEYKHIHEALDYTRHNFESVQKKYPGKPVVITEAGWATRTNGRGIDAEHVSEQNQQVYFDDLMAWTNREGILTFYFEAFDEPWKGSPDPLEPEKHWGLFHSDRRPKAAIQAATRLL